MDNRRRQYVPMDVRLPFGKFGSKLVDRWQMEGLGCWMAYLAACKREPVQGQLTYTSEEEAWTKLGATASFTLDAFFTFTGQQKKTRRTRHGRTTYVLCTSWETWNTPRGRGLNPSTQPLIAETLPRDVAEMRRDVAPEVEVEVEGDTEGEGSAYLGLPFENELLTARLMKVIGESADEGTEKVIRSYAARLAPNSLSKVIETTGRKPAKDRARYANGALQSELRERTA